MATPPVANVPVLPEQIVFLADPYPSPQAALADEDGTDWIGNEDNARAITLAHAARELRDHLALVGIDTPIAGDDPNDKRPKIVLAVKEQAYAHFANSALAVSYGELGDQGYAVTRIGNELLITGNTRIGVLYGVYGLLERLGFSWDDPFETHVPDASARASLIALSEMRERPRVARRGFWIFGAAVPDEFALWMARNRFNLGGTPRLPLQRKLGIVGWGGDHGLLQEEFSRAGLFDQHPEWFALVGGVRQPVVSSGDYFNPAFGNADAAAYFADRMIERLERGDLKGIDVLNVWPTDDRFNKFDQSPEAKALGNETDNLLIFYVRLNRSLGDAYRAGRLSRPVTVAGISYFLTMDPPTNHSVVAQLTNTDYLHIFYLLDRDWSGSIDGNLEYRDANRRIAEKLSAWKAFADLSYGEVEYHNLSSYAALSLSDFPFFAGNFEKLTTTGSSLFAYMHPLLKNPGPRRLTNALMSRLAWHDLASGASPDEIKTQGERVIAEFFARRYGAYAGEWREIHELMAQSVENAKVMFGPNSLYWLLFEDFIWAEPPYTSAEAVTWIPRFREGGMQDLPDRFSPGTTNREDFRGLDEAIRLQEQALPRWRAMSSKSIPAEIRQRMDSDVLWFEATASRYRLMSATCDFLIARQSNLDVNEARSRITQEIGTLEASPVIRDTISPVDQIGFLDYDRRLIDGH